jgi:putative transposase
MARRTTAKIDDDLIDKLLEGREHSAALLGNDGLIGELKKRLAERMLSAQMDEHLGDQAQQAAGRAVGANGKWNSQPQRNRDGAG